MSSIGHIRAGTLQEVLAYCSGGSYEAQDFLEWPPDVFGLMAYVLKLTGAYLHVLKYPSHYKTHPRRSAEAGSAWRTYATAAAIGSSAAQPARTVI